MAAKDQAEELIDLLLNYLHGIQNKDGSFEVKFHYPSQPGKGWISWGNTPYDTASVLLSVLAIDTETAREIVAKGNEFLLGSSLNRKVWRFSAGQGYDPLPYDSDATALCSWVLKQSGYTIVNKELLNSFIDEDQNYKTWLLPKFPSRQLPVGTFLQMLYGNARALLFNKLNISHRDREFAMNCNILLHTGKMKSNLGVWNKIKTDFANHTIERRYYDLFYSIYAYARLFYRGEHEDLFLSGKIVAAHVDRLYGMLDHTSFKLQDVFLANTLLYFGQDRHAHQQLMDRCFTHIKDGRYKTPAAYYSSHNMLDTHPETGEALNVFGSPALTTALYLEFLQLYGKQNIQKR
jgi:hypothetical protein